MRVSLSLQACSVTLSRIRTLRGKISNAETNTMARKSVKATRTSFPRGRLHSAYCRSIPRWCSHRGTRVYAFYRLQTLRILDDTLRIGAALSLLQCYQRHLNRRRIGPFYALTVHDSTLRRIRICNESERFKVDNLTKLENTSSEPLLLICARHLTIAGALNPLDGRC